MAIVRRESVRQVSLVERSSGDSFQTRQSGFANATRWQRALSVESRLKIFWQRWTRRPGRRVTGTLTPSHGRPHGFGREQVQSVDGDEV